MWVRTDNKKVKMRGNPVIVSAKNKHHPLRRMEKTEESGSGIEEGRASGFLTSHHGGDCAMGVGKYQVDFHEAHSIEHLSVHPS